MFENKLHFVQSDIQLVYNNDGAKKKYDSSQFSQYYFIIFYSGQAEIIYKNKLYFFKPGDVFIANRMEKFVVNYGEKSTHYLEIRFFSKFFRSIDQSFDILKPFTSSSCLKIFNKNMYDNNFTTSINNIVRALSNHSSRVFVVSAVLQMLCELNYIAESISPTVVKETDSNFAKIISYIEEHLFEEITLKTVSENCFLSERSISGIIRKICHTSFHNLILEKRLYEAKKLFDNPNYSLKSIASTCGYETYSTFFRVFKKQFGISPKDYQNKILAQQKSIK